MAFLAVSMTELDQFKPPTSTQESTTSEQLTLPTEAQAEAMLGVFRAVNVQLSDELHKKHGNGNTPPRPYHSLEHSREVGNRLRSLFDTFADESTGAPWLVLEIPERVYNEKMASASGGVQRLVSVYRAYAEFLAFGHDIVQEAVVAENGMLERTRGVHQGGNEHESVKVMVQMLEAKATEMGCDAFSNILPSYAERIHRDISATYPDFQTDHTGTLSEVTTPYAESSSFLGQLLAHADLYAQYAGTEAEALRASALEFQETQVWARAMLEKHSTVEELNDEEVSQLFVALASWHKEQPVFMQSLARGHNTLKRTMSQKIRSLTSTDSSASHAIALIDEQDNVDAFTRNTHEFEQITASLTEAHLPETQRQALSALLEAFHYPHIQSTTT